MDRASENEAVGLLRLVEEFVHGVVHEASEACRFSVRASPAALAASETAGYRLHAQPYDFSLHSCSVEFLLDLGEGRVCTALLMRTAVY